MEGPNSPRLPLSARWGHTEGAFWAVARTAGLQSGCALERLGAGEVGPAPASLCPRVHGVNKSARGALCGPNPSALGAHPARGPLRQSIFAQSTAGRTKRHNGRAGSGDVRGVHIKKRQRKDRRGQREGKREKGPTVPPPPPRTIQRAYLGQ